MNPFPASIGYLAVVQRLCNYGIQGISGLSVVQFFLPYTTAQHMMSSHFPFLPHSFSPSLYLSRSLPLSFSLSLSLIILVSAHCVLLLSHIITNHYKVKHKAHTHSHTHCRTHSLSQPCTVTLTLTRTFFFVEYCTKKEQQQQYLHKQIAPSSQRVLRRSFFSSSTSSSCKLVSFGL